MAEGSKIDPEAHFAEIDWMAGGLAAASAAGFLVIASRGDLNPPLYVGAFCFSIALPLLIASAGMLRQEKTYDVWRSAPTAPRVILGVLTALGTLAAVGGFASLFYAVHPAMCYIFLTAASLSWMIFCLHEWAVRRHRRRAPPPGATSEVARE